MHTLRYPFPPHWIYSRRGMTGPICVHCGDGGSGGGARLPFSEDDEQRSPCCEPFLCTSAAGTLRFKTGNPGWLPFKALSVNVGFEKPVVSISKDSRDNSMAAAKVKRIWENFHLPSQVNRRHAEVQLISPVSWSLYSKAKANKNIITNKYIGNNI